MSTPDAPLISPLAAQLTRFLAQKHAMGYRYRDEARALRELDRFWHLTNERICIPQASNCALYQPCIARRKCGGEAVRLPYS